MDIGTRKALDFPKIINLIQSYTSSPLGADITASLLSPMTSPSEVKNALRETAEMVGLIKTKGRIPFGGAEDIGPDIRKVRREKSVLEPDQLLKVAELLGVVREVKNFIGGEEKDICPLLLPRVRALEPLTGLLDNIRRCVGPDASILDGASPELRRIRKGIGAQRTRIKKALEKIMARHKDLVQESLITVRNGRYVIPLRHDSGRALMGIVHDKSQSGHTFFIEPGETIEFNNELANQLKDQEVEIYRILSRLTEEVTAEEEAIDNNCRILGELDHISAKAQFSLEFKCCEPIISGDCSIDLVEARHPLLLLKGRDAGDGAPGEKEEVVPLTVSLGKDYNTLLISGPNTGGKTVALKTVGLLSLMAQAGSHIPAAEGSSVGVFNAIFADIGDDQSIEKNLSTFSSHMRNIVDIANNADQASLVLLDELGSGTDPSEGAVLGIALLEHLNSRDVRTIATTHHDLIKTHAYTSDGMENGSFEFDVRTLRPTYNFLPGLPGSSNALEIASRLGLPEPLLQRARLELGDSRLNLQQLISELKGNIKKLEEEKELVSREKGRLLKMKKQYISLIDIEREANENTRRELRQKISDFMTRTREEVKSAINEMESSTGEKAFDAPAQRALVRMSGGVRDLALARKTKERQTGELHKGDPVLVSHLGLRGTLLEEPSTSESVYVKYRDKTLHVPLAELQKDIDAPPQTAGSLDKAVRYELNPACEYPLNSVNVIGKTVEEALPLVDKAVDDAVVRSASSLIVIHGMGTGRLKEAVDQLLGDHPLVRSHQPASRQEGGRGATVVEL